MHKHSKIIPLIRIDKEDQKEQSPIIDVLLNSLDDINQALEEHLNENDEKTNKSDVQ